MARHKRIPGGEKTAKTGVEWSESELNKVFNLYIVLNGKRLHENNPAIQKLASELGRSVRSVEAQTLMFRNLERDGNYSHGNMNTLCKKIWDERRVNMQTDELEINKNKLFPNAFFSWSGSSDGAVKRPFEVNEKRLIGPIKTKVVERLHGWAENVVNGLSCPRSVFLVGGPGNGKTDAVESTVRKLGVLLGCPDEIEIHFRDEYARYLDHGVLPRKVEFRGRIGEYDGLVLVQDATVRDVQISNKTAQELLLEDLEDIVLNSNSRQLYICCVNRGVLAESISVAANSLKKESTVNFLNHVSYAVTSHPDSVDAWPLSQFPDVAVWPMDIESLVDPVLYEGGETPGHQIYGYIADATLWKNHGDCSAKKYCPFHANQEMLSDPKVREAFLNLLHAYELVSGKRWNFRELFGLVSAIMVGPEKDYKGLSPCDWVHKQLDKATGSGDNNESYKASFNLVTKLYTHALFPRWPKLGSLRSQFAQKLKSSGNTFSGQRETVQGFLGALFQRTPDNSSTISTMLHGVVGEALDPVGYSGERTINDSGTISICQIEEYFSHSVALGMKIVNRYLVGPEKLLFKHLQLGEKFLENTEMLNKANLQIAKAVHGSIKIFAARVFKRSIGVRRGIYQHVDEIELYKQTLNTPQEMGRLKRIFEKLINHDSSFQASLVTTFGQPEPSPSRNAILKSPWVPVKSLQAANGDARPRLIIPYFRVRNRTIPLTFELYFALHHSRAGLAPSSLPEEVFALLDSTKSCALGEIVRDGEMIDQFDILVGGLDEVIKYDDVGGFYVERIRRG